MVKRFVFMQDYGEHKKDDIVNIETDMVRYHEIQHRLIMRKILKTVETDRLRETVETDRYAELKALNKDEQIEMINQLSPSAEIPRLEHGRIELIIQLEER